MVPVYGIIIRAIISFYSQLSSQFNFNFIYLLIYYLFYATLWFEHLLRTQVK